MTKKKSHRAPKTLPAGSTGPVVESNPGITHDAAAADELKNAAGLDDEIAILRRLIRQAGKKMDDDLNFEEQLDLLETVGKTAPALARLLKARRDLANEELDPSAMLRQALLELEEEWPELKKFGEQFKKGN